jgi:hypothetical protein
MYIVTPQRRVTKLLARMSLPVDTRKRKPPFREAFFNFHRNHTYHSEHHLGIAYQHIADHRTPDIRQQCYLALCSLPGRAGLIPTVYRVGYGCATFAQWQVTSTLPPRVSFPVSTDDNASHRCTGGVGGYNI